MADSGFKHVGDLSGERLTVAGYAEALADDAELARAHVVGDTVTDLHLEIRGRSLSHIAVRQGAGFLHNASVTAGGDAGEIDGGILVCDTALRHALRTHVVHLDEIAVAAILIRLDHKTCLIAVGHVDDFTCARIDDVIGHLEDLAVLRRFLSDGLRGACGHEQDGQQHDCGHDGEGTVYCCHWSFLSIECNKRPASAFPMRGCCLHRGTSPAQSGSINACHAFSWSEAMCHVNWDR